MLVQLDGCCKTAALHGTVPTCGTFCREAAVPDDRGLVGFSASNQPLKTILTADPGLQSCQAPPWEEGTNNRSNPTPYGRKGKAECTISH
jgi:hypothetical protein